MRYGLRSVVMMGMVLGASCAHAADIVDPVFGLHYDPANVHFERAPSDLGPRCALLNDHWDRALSIYASLDDEGMQYLIVAGRFLPKDNNPRPSMGDKLGAILRLTNGTCELIGPVRETLDISGDVLSDATRQALADAAVAHYVKAFGGRAALDAALAKQHISLTHSAVLTQALSSEHP